MGDSKLLLGRFAMVGTTQAQVLGSVGNSHDVSQYFIKSPLFLHRIQYLDAFVTLAFGFIYPTT